MSVITLTTDFGTRDGYVGAMKGKILSIVPSGSLVDITHDLPPQNLMAAAYCIQRSLPCFSSDTIHIAVIDPGVGSDRGGLAIKTPHGIWIGPDNGIVSLLLNTVVVEQMVRIHKHTPFWQSHASFDGLAVFAPVAAHLSGGMSLFDVGVPASSFQKLQVPDSVETAGYVAGTVILFDRFGNALTNLRASQWHTRPVKIFFRNQEIPLYHHYEAGRSEPLMALINSDGLLELACYADSAQIRWDLKENEEVRIVFQE
ncbi:MAG: SAM-dependent chlorinase/fluorinase [SAR324 cluster bacterium]|nr:SAM-dependent chlorinase/fluorinase [SAR324 cluster bacterium]